MTYIFCKHILIDFETLKDSNFFYQTTDFFTQCSGILSILKLKLEKNLLDVNEKDVEDLQPLSPSVVKIPLTEKSQDSLHNADLQSTSAIVKPSSNPKSPDSLGAKLSWNIHLL